MSSCAMEALQPDCEMKMQPLILRSADLDLLAAVFNMNAQLASA